MQTMNLYAYIHRVQNMTLIIEIITEIMAVAAAVGTRFNTVCGICQRSAVNNMPSLTQRCWWQ